MVTGVSVALPREMGHKFQHLAEHSLLFTPIGDDFFLLYLNRTI